MPPVLTTLDIQGVIKIYKYLEIQRINGKILWKSERFPDDDDDYDDDDDDVDDDDDDDGNSRDDTKFRNLVNYPRGRVIVAGYRSLC